MSEPYVTLLWPLHLSRAPGFPVPHGYWHRREDGRVQARYRDEEELEACLLVIWVLWVSGIVELVRILTERKGENE